MKIQIDGTNTLNKGAELMLYAILEQIEDRKPNAKVLYNSNYVGRDKQNISTILNLKTRFWLKYSRFPKAILRRLGFSYTFFTSKYPTKGVDIILDAAGFQFSDQWEYTNKRLNELETYYKTHKKRGAKIVFLPQAFGPFESIQGKQSIEIISKYADLIIARDKISFNYLLNAGANKNQVLLYPDFTVLIKGNYNGNYNIEGKVCIIPNNKMITHTSLSKEDYLSTIVDIISFINSKNKEVFLLNHEGIGDFELCNSINKRLNKTIPVLSELNAIEVKGVIGKSYMVISSRYHGVASALTQGIPCLSTSWNHKYEMLFKDFNLNKDFVLDLNDNRNKLKKSIEELLDEENNSKISLDLLKSKNIVKEKINGMWDYVWNKI